MDSKQTRFVSTEPWCADRPETLVVCCSDGRWHAQIEEFIRAWVPARPDMYAVPGGPACLSMWSSVFQEGRGLQEAFQFLAKHHNLRSSWLIAHQNCAYYLNKYGSTKDAKGIYQRQLEDLEHAKSRISQWKNQLEILKVFATIEEGKIVFTLIP